MTTRFVELQTAMRLRFAVSEAEKALELFVQSLQVLSETVAIAVNFRGYHRSTWTEMQSNADWKAIVAGLSS